MKSPLVAVDAPHGGHFVVAATGADFVPRGFDYQPLVRVPGTAGHYVNVTFSPSYYSKAKADAAIAAWHAEGYNACRVFLNPTEIGRSHGRGLSAAYLANLAAFVRAAARRQIRTIVTIGSLPTKGGFTPRGDRSFGLYNEDYLDPAFLDAERRYLGALVSGLRLDAAPLQDVLWELKGEQDWNLYAAPLSWRSGRVKTADGHTYDMASASSRRAMEQGNLAHWANELAWTLHRLVPGSLVGVGVYPPSVKRRGWVVLPGPLFSKATRIDFVDVHLYPNLGPEAVQMASFDARQTQKPVIMGEFGATRDRSLAAAAGALVSWQARSCHLVGPRLSGWLAWSWDSNADGQFWAAASANGTIAKALAPINRPNPCGYEAFGRSRGTSTPASRARARLGELVEGN
jgi:hypothetical protein